MKKSTKQEVIEEIQSWATVKNYHQKDGYKFLKEQLSLVDHWKMRKRTSGEHLKRFQWTEVTRPKPGERSYRKDQSNYEIDQTSDYDIF